MGIVKRCLYCNKEFTLRCRGNDKKYCTHKCYAEHTKAKTDAKHKPRKGLNRCSSAATIYQKYHNMRSRAISKHIPIDTLENIVNWHENEIKVCCYCGMPQEIWEEFFGGFHNKFGLTVDRKENSKGYVVGNMVLACGMCNVVKNNIFTFDEMKSIGEIYIKPKWQQKITENKKCLQA